VVLFSAIAAAVAAEEGRRSGRRASAGAEMNRSTRVNFLETTPNPESKRSCGGSGWKCSGLRG
jgi:hypothetical protein